MNNFAFINNMNLIKILAILLFVLQSSGVRMQFFMIFAVASAELGDRGENPEGINSQDSICQSQQASALINWHFSELWSKQATQLGSCKYEIDGRTWHKGESSVRCIGVVALRRV